MNEDSIRALLRHGEALDVEFKGEARKAIPDSAIVAEIVAMANTSGGTLLIGVEDDGTVSGARPRHGTETHPIRVQTMIRNNTVPPIDTRASLIPSGDGVVLAIEVDRMASICATRGGKCLRRVLRGPGDPETVPYYPHEHSVRGSALSDMDFSAHRVAGATWDELDPLEFQRMRGLIPELGGERRLLELPDRELAKALRLVETLEHHLVPTYAGLLLVGRQGALESFLPTHGVRFQVIDQRGDVRANEVFRGPLIMVVEQLMDRFVARNEEREVLVGMVRLPVPDYSPEGYREAVLNALLHRQYAEKHDVYIQWHADHIAIANPGGFPEGITPQNVLTHEPRPRNARLMEACRRVGLVEQVARGVDKIYRGQVSYGRPIPDYSRSDSTGVRLLLRGGGASLEFAALVYEQERAQTPLTLDHILVLNLLLHERRTDADAVARLIQKGMAEARATLESLVERGFVEATGERKGRAYHMASAIYRRLGEPGGYVRAHGIDPLRQEALVLEYVRAHGKVTRGDVMALCSLTEGQAKALLQRLRSKHDEFQLRGAKRGAHYIWASEERQSP
ncbi:MAG: AAA family ATPase [Armatimonadia bacterium]|nr:AAA family ATPase [Armatimonadia bacterium]